MASPAKLKSWLRFIKRVGDEQGFDVGDGETAVKISIEAYHGIAFRVQINSGGYLQVQQWECNAKGKGKYGRAVYSIRTNSDVVQFCAVIIASGALRARRKGDAGES